MGKLGFDVERLVRNGSMREFGGNREGRGSEVEIVDSIADGGGRRNCSCGSHGERDKMKL